jgi:glutathione synthase/RimK-type ligase-like ATP-grasp enzyme
MIALDYAPLVVGAALSLLSARPACGNARRLPRSALLLNGADLSAEAAAGRFLIDGVEVVFRGIEEIAMAVRRDCVRIYEIVEGRDLADFGLVQACAYPPPTATLLTAIAAYLDARNVRTINLAGIGAPTKLLQYVRLAQAGLPVPGTSYVPTSLLRGSYPALAEELGTPFVLKTVGAGGCARGALIASEADFAGRIGGLHTRRSVFLAQEFVPSDEALRLFVFGGEVRVAIRRDDLGLMAEPGTGPAILVDPAAVDPEARRLAARATAVMNYEIASVDVMRHWPTRHWYVLAAGTTGAISSEPFMIEKISAYADYLEQQLS